MGKGHALRHAFNFVSGDLVTFLDADLDLSPKTIEVLLKYMTSSNADIVIGSKYHPDSKIKYPKNRRILSYLYHLFTKLLFGLPVNDTQVGIKLFKKKVLDDIFPRVLVKGYAFDLELLVNALNRNYKIVEAPIVLDFKRSFGRISLKDIKNIFIDTSAIFYRLKILHYYDKEIKK
jgi:glycosyltransferase involved in cell wall biosynthesis